jgi:leucyl aminopeptidase
MDIQFETTPIEKLEADALAIICFEATERPEGTIAVSSETAPDPAITDQSGWLKDLRLSGEFTGKLYELAVLYRPERTSAKRLIVVGGGKKDKFSPVETRRIGGALVRSLKPKGIRKLAILVDSSFTPDHLEAFSEGVLLGDWEAHKYKSDPKKNEKQIEAVTFLAASDSAHAYKQAVDRGEIIAAAQNFARDLVNEPANKLTPAGLAEAAKEMCGSAGLECEVLDEGAIRELGMGALLGVAQGSVNPPFLIVMKYRPPASAGEDHLALVGKGVTFDTGGVSIKPSEGMEKMKYDMAGAAAVIGAMKAIAQLKPSLNVTAYVPTVENMVNGNAQRPGDIVTSLAGKTIEVLNTDAEGRLILADAITYANRHGATHIVDAATLTGAIGIALGHHNMGAFTNNGAFLGKFLAASRKAGEKAWELPMDEEYKDYLKSAFADLPNIGGRYGGSITAAWFLREFAEPTPWVHLDIASTAWLDDAKPWQAKGPTGVAVRSFVQLASTWDGQPARG